MVVVVVVVSGLEYILALQALVCVFYAFVFIALYPTQIYDLNEHYPFRSEESRMLEGG